MRRNTYSKLTGLVVAILGLGAAACTDAGATVYILQNNVADADCVAPAAVNATYRPIGRVDVSATGYLMFPVAYNQSDKLGAGDGVFFAEGADTVATFPEGFVDFSPNLLVNTQRFSGPIPAGGYGVFAMNALSSALMTEVRDSNRLAVGDEVEVQVEITMFGKVDGKTIEAYPFVYPIVLSNGVIARDLGSCANVPVEYDPGTGFECNPYAFQDEFVACCTTSGGFFLCPAAGEQAPPAL